MHKCLFDYITSGPIGRLEQSAAEETAVVIKRVLRVINTTKYATNFRYPDKINVCVHNY